MYAIRSYYDNARVTFWHHWEFEVSAGGGAVLYDGAFLAVDANGDNNYAIAPSSP